MAHRISSALFKEENKTSKGQQMYINRAKKSGKFFYKSWVKKNYLKVLNIVKNP